MDDEALDTYLRGLIEGQRAANPGDPRFDIDAFAPAILDGTAPPHELGPELAEPLVPTLRQRQEREGHRTWARLQHEECASALEDAIFDELGEDEVRCTLYHLAYWEHQGHRDPQEWAQWMAA